MLAGTLAFISGIYSLMQFSSLPSLLWLLLLPVLFISTRFFSFFKYFLFFFIGFSWALFSAHLKLANSLDPEIESRDVVITGVITSVVETNEDYSRFLINLESIKDSSGKTYAPHGLTRLNWYKTDIIPAPGEKWQFKVRMKRPYGFMNPGGFDYEAWMLRQNIKATGYVKASQENIKLADSHQHFIQKQRFNIANKLKQTLDKPLLGLVLALTLGDRSQLDAEQWQVLTQTGTNHLIAISGLHLGLIAGFVYLIAYFFWRQFYCLTQRLPAPHFASFMSFNIAFIYALLSGFALPAQRALIMLAVVLYALLQARRLLVSHVLSVAAVLILLLDPFAIIAADFYLSFMAVTFILYLSLYRKNKNSVLKKWFVLQCLLSLCLIPILILWFKQIPIYGVLANLIAIPVIGFLIVPISLFALLFLFPFPTLSNSLYLIIEKIYIIQWTWLELLSEQTHSIIPVAATNNLTIFLAIVGVLILTMPKGLPGRHLGLFFFLPLLFPINTKLKQGEFDFNLLDVGQGLSALIQTQNHTLLYDTGARFSDRFNIGDAVVKPYLRQKGINELSILIISHGDNDHIGGAKSVINNFRVDKIISSVPRKLEAHNVVRCLAGQSWQWDGVLFEIISPELGSVLEGNNASCVLKISSPQGSVLLTGDIEKQAEFNLLNRRKSKLASDILLVPHHGSRTSSMPAFISAVSAEHAFLAVGYKNRFGFPKQDIMARYDAQKVKTYVSYETGELSAKFRQTGLQIDEFRTKNRRFWHYKGHD